MSSMTKASRSTKMATVYKDQHKMLCPYYVRERAKSIGCEMDGVQWVVFTDGEEKQKYKQHNCYFASPVNCERYMEHRQRVLAGEEAPARPRQHMDTSRKDYHTKWVRERRKDPNYKY